VRRAAGCAGQTETYQRRGSGGQCVRYRLGGARPGALDRLRDTGGEGVSVLPTPSGIASQATISLLYPTVLPPRL